MALLLLSHISIDKTIAPTVCVDVGVTSADHDPGCAIYLTVTRIVYQLFILCMAVCQKAS